MGAQTGKWSDQFEFIILETTESSDNCHLLGNYDKNITTEHTLLHQMQL